MSEILVFLDTLSKIAMMVASSLAMWQSMKNGRSLSVLKVEVNGKVSELLEAHKALAEAKAKAGLLEGVLLANGGSLVPFNATKDATAPYPVSTMPVP